MGEQEEIEYSAEELAEIENLTSFFNNPGHSSNSSC